jgi:small subunit ribosomal protein S1
MVDEKQLKMPVDSDAPELDEGWWAAILADEIAATSSTLEPAAKPSETATDLTFVDWDHVQTLFENDAVIYLLVHGYNRGGLLVQGDRIQGFVPISHLVDAPSSASDDDRRRVLAGYVGQTLELKVIECEPSAERIVLSERAAQAGEGRRKELFKSLRVGSITSGTVTNITDFGVFIDLGGVEGLIHVSELSWGRVQHPADVVKIGERLQVLVLQVNEDNARIALSLKRLQSNPWDVLMKTYKPGDVVSATITSIMRFGAFAQLPEGVEGLIHISSVHGPGSDHDMNDLLHTGMIVQVKILHIDPERRRLGLGLVQP